MCDNTLAGDVLLHESLPACSEQAVISEARTACRFPVAFFNTLLEEDTINAV